jgi:hypothetical protein
MSMEMLGDPRAHGLLKAVYEAVGADAEHI